MNQGKQWSRHLAAHARYLKIEYMTRNGVRPCEIARLLGINRQYIYKLLDRRRMDPNWWQVKYWMKPARLISVNYSPRGQKSACR